ncbi:MAG: hypothetical protein ABIK92_20875 [Pseudomonadota bacterium]
MNTWMKKNIKILILIYSILFVTVIPIKALEVDTHEAINKHIAKNAFNGFSFDQYLKNQLGIQEGKDTLINNKEIIKWFGDGGKMEDKPGGWCIPYWRSRNHFHNPIDNRGFSGWWDTGFLSGMSIIDWALQPLNSQYCGYYSWNDARSYYYKALTDPDEDSRENNFAETFRALGQIMHLVQDVSVPEHVRNDGHYFAFDYEKWVDKPANRKKINNYTLESHDYFSANTDPKSAIDFYKGVILALSNKKSAKRTKNAYYKPLH